MITVIKLIREIREMRYFTNGVPHCYSYIFWWKIENHWTLASKQIWGQYFCVQSRFFSSHIGENNTTENAWNRTKFQRNFFLKFDFCRFHPNPILSESNATQLCQSCPIRFLSVSPKSDFGWNECNAVVSELPNCPSNSDK